MRAAYAIGQCLFADAVDQFLVVVLADGRQVGSTDFIIKAVAAAPVGATIAIGTEIHLVNRLAAETPDKTVVSLDPLVCPCSTMFRIDAPHLAWILENLVEGRVLNQITVDENTTRWAKVALQRMLDITQGNLATTAAPEPVTAG